MPRRAAPAAEVDLASSWPLPAPIRGWNARDSIARMVPGDAIALDNWFPGTTAVSVRQGSVTDSTLPAGKHIESLLTVALPAGTFGRFAAAEDGIYDITPTGTIAAPSSAATTGRWEYTQINVGGTAYLWCCAGDGANKSRIYNSDTAVWTELDGASVPVLTGPTSEDVSNVSLWKYRLILCQRNSLKFWYGPLNSLGGVFQAFDLGQVFTKGGYLMATANWTVDGGNGPDDRFVAISSEGEVAVYQGTDPSDPTTFSIVGVYALGKPVGKRCVMKMAGDLAILTESGLWPLSRALQSNQMALKDAFTDRIQWAFNSYFKTFGDQYGWSMTLLPKGPAILVNVPLSSTISYQFVMNTITGAWCRFTGWPASCMAVVDGKLYIAIGNKVKEAWTGFADDNAAINALAVNGFAYGPDRGRTKKISLVRPIMACTYPVRVTMAIDTDFKTRTGLQAFLSNAGAPSTFDAAIYDESLWSGADLMVNYWKQVPNTPGKAFSLRARVFVKNIQVDWAATDFITEPGGIL